MDGGGGGGDERDLSLLPTPRSLSTTGCGWLSVARPGAAQGGGQGREVWNRRPIYGGGFGPIRRGLPILPPAPLSGRRYVRGAAAAAGTLGCHLGRRLLQRAARWLPRCSLAPKWKFRLGFFWPRSISNPQKNKKGQNCEFFSLKGGTLMRLWRRKHMLERSDMSRRRSDN